jgi:hypothetical protein
MDDPKKRDPRAAVESTRSTITKCATGRRSLASRINSYGKQPTGLAQMGTRPETICCRADGDDPPEAPEPAENFVPPDTPDPVPPPKDHPAKPEAIDKGFTLEPDEPP